MEMPLVTIIYPKSPQIMKNMLSEHRDVKSLMYAWTDELLEIHGDLSAEIINYLRQRTECSEGPIDLRKYYDDSWVAFTVDTWKSNRNTPIKSNNLDLPVEQCVVIDKKPWLATKKYVSMNDFMNEFIDDYEHLTGLPWITFPEGFKKYKTEEELNSLARLVLNNILRYPVNADISLLEDLLDECELVCSSPEHDFIIPKGSAVVPALYQLYVWILAQYPGIKKTIQSGLHCSFSDMNWLKHAIESPTSEPEAPKEEKEHIPIDWTWRDTTKEKLHAFQQEMKLFADDPDLADILRVCEHALNVDVALKQCNLEFSWSYIDDFFNGTLFNKHTELKDAYRNLSMACSVYIDSLYTESNFNTSYKNLCAKKALTLITAYRRSLDDAHTKHLMLYSDIELRQRMDVVSDPKIKSSFDQIVRLLINSKVKYYSKAPDLSSFDALHNNFPLFTKVTTFIQQHIKLSSLTTHSSVTIPPILLVGGPGIGKTRYLSEIAKILNVPFNSLGMSSATTGWLLSGLDLSWSGGKPGMLFNALTSSPCANPIFLLDELDKASTSSKDSPIGALYQLLEPHTAKNFIDEAVGVPINASGCIWFATANHIEDIPSPIRSRFQVFEIPKMDKNNARAVACSMYNDFLDENDWGNRFNKDLDTEVIEKMSSLSPRDMRFVLLQAFANAADRAGHPQVKIIPSDLNLDRPSVHKVMGFTPE